MNSSGSIASNKQHKYYIDDLGGHRHNFGIPKGIFFILLFQIFQWLTCYCDILLFHLRDKIGNTNELRESCFRLLGLIVLVLIVLLIPKETVWASVTFFVVLSDVLLFIGKMSFVCIEKRSNRYLSARREKA